MTALSVLRAKAEAEHPGYELELSPKKTVLLKSILMLDEAELRLFNASQKKLAEMDSSEDTEVEDLKSEFVNLLAGVSTDRAATAAALDKEALGTLMALFKEYAGSAEDAAKSEDAS